ncbi:MAG: hypothetical protein H8D23_25085 [Candidatus Brocadiales bacterium]|nr:hypothetical protein [Candidatus Brocadiales bacterium]
MIHQVETNDNAINFWLKACISVWMLAFFLLYLVFSDSAFVFINSVAQMARIPWLNVQFIQVREFFLQFFTAPYLF